MPKRKRDGPTPTKGIKKRKQDIQILGDVILYKKALSDDEIKTFYDIINKCKKRAQYVQPNWDVTWSPKYVFNLLESKLQTIVGDIGNTELVIQIKDNLINSKDRDSFLLLYKEKQTHTKDVTLFEHYDTTSDWNMTVSFGNDATFKYPDGEITIEEGDIVIFDGSKLLHSVNVHETKKVNESIAPYTRAVFQFRHTF